MCEKKRLDSEFCPKCFSIRWLPYAIYKFYEAEQPLTWYEAVDFCAAQGAGISIASQTNEGEYNACKTAIAFVAQGGTADAWIGLNDIEDERASDPDGWTWYGTHDYRQLTAS